jgi:hypothetical protein
MTFQKAIVVNPPSPTKFVSNKDSMGGLNSYSNRGHCLPAAGLDLSGALSGEEKVFPRPSGMPGLDLDKEVLVKGIASAGGSVLIIVRTSAPTLDWDVAICDSLKQQKPDCRIAIYGGGISETPD